MQVGEFFSRCNANIDASIRTIESGGVAEIGRFCITTAANIEWNTQLRPRLGGQEFVTISFHVPCLSAGRIQYASTRQEQLLVSQFEGMTVCLRVDSPSVH